VKSPEIPWANEDYYYREPTMVKLEKGWNRVLIKVPHTKKAWKWMFTCVPVEWDGVNVTEKMGLILE